MKKKLPRSLRKFIRKEKARIRRQFSDPLQVEEAIKEIYNKINSLLKKDENKRDFQISY